VHRSTVQRGKTRVPVAPEVKCKRKLEASGPIPFTNVSKKPTAIRSDQSIAGFDPLLKSAQSKFRGEIGVCRRAIVGVKTRQGSGRGAASIQIVGVRE
jgi:hypothetical protein